MSRTYGNDKTSELLRQMTARRGNRMVLYILGGLSGAVLGLIIGLLLYYLTPHGLGVIRVGLISSFIGFGTVLVPLIFLLLRRRPKEAAVEVHWSPEKISTVGLGRRPLTIGGGADDIVIPGAPPRVSTIVMEKGAIEHIETSTGARTPLKDGSRLRIGGLVMVVHGPE